MGKKSISRLKGLGRKLRFLAPGIETEFIRAKNDKDADSYRAACLIDSLAIAVIAGALVFTFIFFVSHAFGNAFMLGLGIGMLLFFILFMVLLKQPKITLGKRSEKIDKDLVYALKDILLSLSSGLSMYSAISLASKSEYGYVSDDFATVVKHSNTGMSLQDALEDLAITTPSEHFQNALWQIINTSKSGADVEAVLHSLIEGLTSEQRSNIQKYSNELNVITLVYMLVAVAIPAIVVTLLIVLNAFGSTGVNEFLFVAFIVLSAVVQIAILGLVRSRRPVVHV